VDKKRWIILLKKKLDFHVKMYLQVKKDGQFYKKKKILVYSVRKKKNKKKDIDIFFLEKKF